jgi:signal recognition particle subunit SRP54
MFDRLGSRLETIFSKLRGYGKITKADIEAGLRDIRLAFLESDVNFRVVKDFIESIRQKAQGERVFESLTPGQQLIKIVKDEMINILGEDAEEVRLSERPPTKIVLVGLQGSGKTTTAAKIGVRLREKGKKALLVSTDVYRPAAQEQLKSIAERSNLAFYEKNSEKPLDIAKDSLSFTKNEGFDALIVDTAGRLHIDEEMMKEAADIQKRIDADEVFYIADSMTGQDAVKSALTFHKKVPLTGVILTKLDGDARGGAAFSIKAVTGVPLRFIGIGEKTDDLELFHPDRLVSRILGMGDVLTLIERAEQKIDREEAEEFAEKMLKDEFTIEDFRKQLHQIKKMGPLNQITSLIPGLSKSTALKNLDFDDKALKRFEAIVNSMTKEERRNHTMLNGSRRKRIAMGSGTTVQEVNQMLKQFVQMKKMMKKMVKFGFKGKSGIIDPSKFM